jgi:hypothetical protein
MRAYNFDLKMWMCGEQPQKLAACVPAGTDDRCFHALRIKDYQ